MDSIYYDLEERARTMEASDDDGLCNLDLYIESAAFDVLPLLEQDVFIARAEGRSS